MRIFEVGPRDGLQNEDKILTVAQKVELIDRLVAAGSRDIEIGSFVHPRWVPQMANTDDVAARIERVEGVRYWALVPNMKGYQRARDAGLSHIAVFGSASETHSRKNINRTIDASMAIFEEVVTAAVADGVCVRAYISMVFGCPYEGAIDFGRVLDLAERFLGFGADHVSLGDTTGVGQPLQVRTSIASALERIGPERLALHLHDTRGMGLTNAMVAFELGMRAFDSSVGGLGGCPYAPGAAGNLGTEDLLYLMASLGAETGYAMEAVSEVSSWLEREVGFTIPSRCHRYMSATAA